MFDSWFLRKQTEARILAHGLYLYQPQPHSGEINDFGLADIGIKIRGLDGSKDS